MMPSRLSIRFCFHRGRSVHAAPAPRAVSGVRAVAAFEAAKGFIVILAALGLLDLLHRDVAEAAENLLMRVHISPDQHLARVFLGLASRFSGPRLAELAGVAAAYSAVRFTEAWGLWNGRAWAQWFGILSGALYLPWELWQLAGKLNWFHAGIVAGNVLILAYLLRLRVWGGSSGGASPA